METENLPQGAAPVAELKDLDKVIQESKATLADVTAPKRPRGRPRKETTTSENNSAEIKASAVTPEIISPNEIEPLATELVKLPFDVVGIKTNIDVTPSDDEARVPSYYLAKLINAYLPDLDIQDPKSFSLIGFLISFALLSVRKARKFFSERKKAFIAAPIKFPKNAKVELTNVTVQKLHNDPQTAGVEAEPVQAAPSNMPPARPLPSESIPASSLFSGGPR